MNLFEKPLVSVIMLTYNREHCVERAIRSILNQTFINFEFILVDNGSTDASGMICDRYAKKDGRVLVIHKERGNIGSGRNAGLGAARGEYISFIDDDDWCEPDYLDFLYNLAEENVASISICGAADKIFYEKNIMNAEKALIELFWRKKYNVAFPAKLFKRTLFEGIRFSETAKYDDIGLMPQIIGKANNVAYHGLPKYTFYRHDTNNSAWTMNHDLLTPETLSEYLNVYRTRTLWLCSKFPDNSELWQYFEWSFWISMIEKIKKLDLTDCFAQCEILIFELAKFRREFIENVNIQSFEREWVEQYVPAK